MRLKQAEVRQPPEARQPWRVAERHGRPVLLVRAEHVLGALQGPLRAHVTLSLLWWRQDEHL